MTISAHGSQAAVVPFPRTGPLPAEAFFERSAPADPTSLLARAMDALDHALIVTDLTSVVLHANQAARTALASGFLKISHGVLCAVNAGENRTLQSAIAGCINGIQPRLLAFDGAGGRQVLTVSAAWAEGRPAGRGQNEGVAVITFRTTTRDGLLSEQMARAFFDLTPAEARVAREVVRGDGMKACAKRLGVTANTARTHLKRVFDKTGTKRQAELVRLLLSCRD